MITQELPRQLKDAGFPNMKAHISKDINITTHLGKEVSRTVEEEIIGYEMPTLSELIEACGECNFTLAQSNSLWNASGADGSSYWIKKGNTPEEAVTKLWLELNKK